MKNKNQNFVIFWSIILISLGGLLLFRNFGLLDFKFPAKIISWRLIPLIIGINALWKGETLKGIIAASIAIIFFMPDFLTNEQFLVYKKLWPLLLIAAGGLVYYNHFYGFKTPVAALGEEGTDAFNYISENHLMGGTTKKVFSQNFKGGRINCIWGGTQLDFTEADLKENAVIDVFVLMGGAELRLPKEWNVKLDVFPLMGGVDDQIRKFPNSVVDESKKITIKGTVIMGGVDIKRY